MNDEQLLELAIDQARIGASEGGIPIGAVLATGQRVLGLGRNRRVQLGSAIRHAEVDAVENAGRLSAQVYSRTTMFTTLSPCYMCAGAILLYGIPRVVIGENRTSKTAEEVLEAHGVRVDVVNSRECVELMETYIIENPEIWAEDSGIPAGR